MPAPIFGLALAGSVIASMLLSGIYTRWPEASTTLLGNVGILPFVVAVATLIFLGINSRYQAKSLRHTAHSLALTQRGELANRFQKALELLESASLPTRIGAITVLRDITMLAPDEYWPAVSNVMVAFLEGKAIQTATEKTENELPRTTTDRDVQEAFEFLGLKDQELRSLLTAKGLVRDTTLRKIKLSGVRLIGLDLRHMEIVEADLTACSFQRCEMSGMKVHADVTQSLYFWDCRAVKAIIRLKSTNGYSASFTQCDLTQTSIHVAGRLNIEVRGCDLQATTIYGMHIRCVGCWHFGEQPNFAAVADVYRHPGWTDVRDIDFFDARGREPVAIRLDGSKSYHSGNDWEGSYYDR